jgi:hypothetical protein
MTERVDSALRTLREIAAFADSTRPNYELADRLRREFVDGLVNITPQEREQVATAIRKATNT